MKTLSFLSMSCHLCDVERNDKDQSKPVVKHSNLSNNSEQHMVVCCLSINLANSKSHQTLLQKKYLFTSALKIHMASIDAFHSIYLFLCFPWYHVSTKHTSVIQYVNHTTLQFLCALWQKAHALNLSFRNSLQRQIHIIYTVEKTKLNMN